MNWTVLPRSEWTAQKSLHQLAVQNELEPYLARRAAHQKDPVHDFLFEYYSFRPSLLSRWTPGAAVILEDANPEEIGLSVSWEERENGMYLRPDLSESRTNALDWLIDLLKKTESRNPRFGCMGLHEWAMVYKTGRRHEQIPLRMTDSELSEFVERSSIRCTHYDAFRFFSEAARPLNKIQPSKELIPELEQPGCLHTNMDLYKWSYKFFPFVSTGLLWSTFLLARDIRRLDMQASPYDLSAFGLNPVKIETARGQEEYVLQQQSFFERAQPLRRQLLDELNRFRLLLHTSLKQTQ